MTEPTSAGLTDSPPPPPASDRGYQQAGSAVGVVRMTIGPQVIAVVLLGIAGGLMAFGVADAARRPLGWAMASAVVAALLEPLVGWLDRYVPRVVAILAGLLVVGVLAGSVVTGILADLGNQFDRLRDDAPRAAAELERSDRFGDAATDFRLEERVEELLDRLRDPTSGLASEAAASAAGAYLVAAVLTAFLLSAGPTYGEAALNQIRDPEQREQVRATVRVAFTNSRTYVLFALGRAAVTGLVAWALCYLEDVPAPIVLGVAVAALSVVPGFGIAIGGVSALLLEAGLGTTDGVLRLAVAFVVLQIVDIVFTRRVVVPRSLTVGPAAIVIAVILGFEVYGVGGAIYAAALAIFGIALLDAAGRPDEAADVEDTADHEEDVDDDVEDEDQDDGAAAEVVPAGGLP